MRDMSLTVNKALIDMAWALANKAHAGQAYHRANCDWEYTTHLKRVVHNLGQVDNVTEVTAILHDVCEDSDVRLDEIYSIFGPRIGNAVDSMTRRAGESYEEYIIRCKNHKIATQVKAVDIVDHILHCVKPDRVNTWESLLSRYVHALDILLLHPQQ